MRIPLKELIDIGRTAFEWGTALRDAVLARDERRVEALLPAELRSVVTLRMGKALAESIALENRRLRENGSKGMGDGEPRLGEYE